jgi:hypothetical protein
MVRLGNYLVASGGMVRSPTAASHRPQEFRTASDEATNASEIRCRQCVGVPALVRIVHLVRDFQNSVTISIEFLKHACLIEPSTRREARESTTFDEEANLKCPIVTPETDTLTAWIVAAASIWKTKGHGGVSCLHWCSCSLSTPPNERLRKQRKRLANSGRVAAGTPTARRESAYPAGTNRLC